MGVADSKRSAAAPTVVALHGFLGESADWRRVRDSLSSFDWIIPDYARESLLSPERTTLETWGDAFHRWLSQQTKDPVILVGYSQGGRLAMHALEKNPSAFKKVILVSAQPGLPGDERPARLANDESWANRFENESWEPTLKAWNAQPVFRGGEEEPARPESAEARRAAAASLRNWSVAKQKDFRPLLKSQREKIVLVAGERDTKYAEMTKALAMEGFQSEIVKNSGHRVLFDAPSALARITSDAAE